MLAPETRRWLAANPHAARYPLESQIHCRGRVALRVAPHQTFGSTTTLTRLDNSLLLPPTARSARGEDILLERLRLVHPSRWQAELPFALPHLRDAPRDWLRPDAKLALSPACADQACGVGARLLPAIRAEAAPARREYGRWAGSLDLATANDGSSALCLEGQAIDYVASIRFSIQEQLADPSLPVAWQEIVQQWLRLADVQARSCLVACLRARAGGGAKRSAALWPDAAGLAATSGLLPGALCMSATYAVATPWLAPALHSWPLAADRCLVRNPLNGAALELSSGEYAVLAACEGCRPLAAHEAHAARELHAPPEHRGGVPRAARALRARRPVRAVPRLRGALRCAVQGRCLASGRHRHPYCRPAATTVAAARERRGARVRGAPPRRWLVFDDSRDPAHQQANRAAVASCRALNVAHHGRVEAAALQGELEAAFPHAQREIAWLLGAGSRAEVTYGRPLNHALLRFAGRAFVSVDDDVILDARRPAISEPGFAVGDDHDELLWYEDAEGLWGACPTLPLDPIAAHASWLGLPLAAAWARAEDQAGPLAAMRFSAPQAERFAPQARVLFTHNHACGDPGSSVLPLQLLTLPQRSRQWLAANPRAAASAFAQRINWRGQTRLRLAPRRVLTLTTLAGIDNSQLLPPTARAGRSEDVLLGILTQLMHPRGWIVDLPFGLPHLRTPAKHWLPSGVSFMQEPLHVLYALLEEHVPRVLAESPSGGSPPRQCCCRMQRR